MKCQHFRKALIERAAVGGKLESNLAGHLEECPQCRVKLEHEERLFAAIDEALRSKVNETPRHGFLASGRSQIREQTPPKSRLAPVLALAGAACALVLIVMFHSWTPSQSRPVEAGRLQTESVKVPAVAPDVLAPKKHGRTKRDLDARARSRQRAATPPDGVQLASREPEVLVPPDEGKAFHQFVARMQGQEQVAQAVANPVVSSVSAEKNELPEIAPVEIARLQLEPLAWENLRDRNKAKIEILCNVITCESY